MTVSPEIQESVTHLFQQQASDEDRVRALFELWWTTSGLDSELQMYMLAALQVPHACQHGTSCIVDYRP